MLLTKLFSPFSVHCKHREVSSKTRTAKPAPPHWNGLHSLFWTCGVGLMARRTDLVRTGHAPETLEDGLFPDVG